MARSLSDLHCNQRHKGDSRYNQRDAGVEDSPDRIASGCDCTDDDSREKREDAARRHGSPHKALADSVNEKWQSCGNCDALASHGGHTRPSHQG